MTMRFPLKIIFCSSLLIAGGPNVLAQRDTLISRTDFANTLFTAKPTNAPAAALSNTIATAFFSGNIGAPANALPGDTNLVTPSDSGGIVLLQSIIGQPVGVSTVPLDFAVTGVGTVDPTPNVYAASNWFQYGQTVSLFANAGRYYGFSKWSDLQTNNPRTITLGNSNLYNAIFTNIFPLYTNVSGGLPQVVRAGTPVVLINGASVSNNIYFTNNSGTVSVTLLGNSGYTNIQYSLDGSDPSTGLQYTGPFIATIPFQIKSIGFDTGHFPGPISDGVFSLVANTPGGGSVAVQTATDLHTGSNSASLTATPSAGWTFINFTNDVTTTSNNASFVMTAPKNVQALFGAPVTPTVNIANAGTVTKIPSQALYPYGTSLKLAAVPAPTGGYRFSSWAGFGIANTTNTPVSYVVTNISQQPQANYAGLNPNEFSFGVASIGSGTVTVAPVAANSYPSNTLLTLTAVNNSGQSFVGWSGNASGTSNPLQVTLNTNKFIYANFAVTAPVFALSSSNYIANETDGFVMITVSNQGVLGTNINFSTSDGTAIAGTDYTAINGTLLFTNGPSAQTFRVAISNEWLVGLSKAFQVFLSSPGIGGFITNPSSAVVTINYNPALPTNGSLLMQAYPGPTNPASGSLQVNLPALEAGESWRLRWEDYWHSGGEVVSNLQAGDYDIQLLDTAGYIAYPRFLTTSVGSSPTTVSGDYKESFPTGKGSLRVDILNVTNGEQWRMVGESNWHNSGDTVSGLVAKESVNAIEFSSVQGQSAPVSQYVSISPNTKTTITTNYLNSTFATNLLLPKPIANFDTINTPASSSPRLPYAFNGQLKSPVNGWASGTVVRSNVVLTAAHVVFDSKSLSYVGPIYWFFQKQIGQYVPIPQSARGWYVQSSYAAARTNDQSLGRITSNSYEYDVAALYFSAPAGRGGFGGYISSDLTTNDWLTSTNSKMLVGYPVDASGEGITNIQPGKMHTTSLFTNAFTQLFNHIYANTNYAGFGGNSGGSLYVQNTNGLYYPAAIHLGLYAGNQYIVRAIDSNVVALIIAAEELGDSGTNQNGGGPLSVKAIGVTPLNPAYLQILISPPAAVAAGANWAPMGSNVFQPYNTNRVLLVTTTFTNVQFANIPMWSSPSSQIPSLKAGDYKTITATYTPIAPQVVFNRSKGFSFTGPIGVSYRVAFSTNLASPVWVTNPTVGITNNPVTIMPWPPTNGLPKAFFKVILLP